MTMLYHRLLLSCHLVGAGLALVPQVGGEHQQQVVSQDLGTSPGVSKETLETESQVSKKTNLSPFKTWHVRLKLTYTLGDCDDTLYKNFYVLINS